MKDITDTDKLPIDKEKRLRVHLGSSAGYLGDGDSHAAHTGRVVIFYLR